MRIVIANIYRRDSDVQYGAQHHCTLDDRDVDEYNKNPKFEPFAHLGQQIQKLIIYSDTDTVLHIDRARLWSATSWTPGGPCVFGYEVAVRPGMNVILFVPHTGL